MANSNALLRAIDSEYRLPLSYEALIFVERLWNRYVWWPRFAKRRIVTALKYAIPNSMRYVPPVIHPYFVPVMQMCFTGSGESMRKAHFTHWIKSRTIFLAPHPDFEHYEFEYVRAGRKK